MVGITTMADLDLNGMPDYVSQMESFQRSDDARQKLIAVCSCYPPCITPLMLILRRIFFISMPI